MENMLGERTFSASEEYLSEIMEFAAGLAEQSGLPGKKQLQLDLIVEEAVLNICNYAYDVPPGELVIRISSDEESFTVEFEDSGIPFDPTEAKDPDVTVSLAERECGGLGMLFIRRMADEVHYRRRGGRNVLAVSLYRSDQ